MTYTCIRCKVEDEEAMSYCGYYFLCKVCYASVPYSDEEHYEYLHQANLIEFYQLLEEGS